MTEAEIRSNMGRQGGLARAAKMSKRARKESALRANQARWAGKKKQITDLQRKRASSGSIKGNAAQRRKAKREAR
jgi:hypothetical protein